MPSIKKVRNWKEYNKNLVKRGEIIFTFDENYLQKLYFSEKQKRGGVRRYNDEMYKFLLTIKTFLRLSWRAATGFAQTLLKKINPKISFSIPNYAHASRESNKLNLKVQHFAPNSPLSGMEISFDSTGVSINYSSKRNGDHNNPRKPGDQWRKIHVALDLNSMQIVAAKYTNSNVGDCEVVKDLCDKIDYKIKNVRCDGAYDAEEIYQIIEDLGAKVIIPPRVNCKTQNELKDKPTIMKTHLKQRDEIIKEIRTYKTFDQGLKKWKIKSLYHKRSLVEACMYRFKRTFGHSLQNKTEVGRRNEIITKINILNKMAAIARAKYYH